LRSKKKGSARLSMAEAERIAGELNVTPDQVLEMEGRLYSHDTAFDATPDEDDERVSQAPAYYLEDSRYDPAVQLEEADWEADSTQRLTAAMDKLDARSKDILTRRWLVDDKATLHELAAEYGVSAERIRQLEKNAMEKVKGALIA
jgi:RNA polymerase sigma-32 factor